MLENWEKAAGIVWDILVDTANKRSTITYEEIAPSIHTNPLSVKNALEPIQAYCLEQSLPPLTALVVGKTTQKPGKGFIAWDPSNLDAAYRAIYSFCWNSVPNPYANLSADESVDDLADRLLADPSAVVAIFARVKVRGVRQRIFRKALLKAYLSRCAICAFSIPCALEAAHIIPWCDAENLEQFDPRNGLLLCSTHHRLFDNGFVTIDQSYKVTCANERLRKHQNQHANHSQTMALQGHLLYLPERKDLWPRPEALVAHRSSHCP